MIIFYFQMILHIYIMYIQPLISKDLKIVFKTIIYTLLITISFVEMYAQNYELKIYSNDSINSAIIDSLDYLKKHNTKNDIIKEIGIFSKKLALKGFINNNYTLTQDDTIFNCTYALNKKVDSVRIYYGNGLVDKKLLEKFTIKYSDIFFEIPIYKIEFVLNIIPLISQLKKPEVLFTKDSTTNANLAISDFKNTFLGLSYTYKSFQNLKNSNNPKLLLNIEYLNGNRTIDNAKKN